MSHNLVDPSFQNKRACHVRDANPWKKSLLSILFKIKIYSSRSEARSAERSEFIISSRTARGS